MLRCRDGWLALLICFTGAFSALGQGSGNTVLPLLSRLVHDESPSVRVEALRALAKIPTAEAAALALSVLEKPMDPNLDYALWLTINDLAEPWMQAVLSGAWSPEGREPQLEFALRALRPDQVGRVLDAVLGDHPLPRDGSGPWVEVIGAAGGPRHLRRVFDQALAGGFDAASTVGALHALSEASRLRDLRPAGDLGGLAGFLRRSEAPVRLEACRLAGGWRAGGNEVVSLLLGLAAHRDTGAEERMAAFGALRQIGGPAVIAGLRDLATRGAGRPSAVLWMAAVNLASLDATAGFPAAARVAESLSSGDEALDLFRGLLAIQGSALPLREALEGRVLKESVARAGMRAAREGGREDLELVAAFAQAGGITQDTAQLTAALLHELAARVATEGDPQRGEQIYRREALACVTCHAIGGAGGKVGPDLTSVGASAPLDYLVESLLMPSAKIKEGYAAVIVETRDGEETTGTLARETPEELFLRNAAGQEVAVPKQRIQRRELGRLSLMPVGLLEPLSETERLDLWAFLGQLGKPGLFDASRGGVARVWRIANLVHTDLQNQQAEWFWDRSFNDPRWMRVFALVRGDLPRETIDQAAQAQAWTSKVAVIVATEMEVGAAGPVRFQVSPSSAEVWVDRTLTTGDGAERTAELGAGRHRVVIRLDPSRLPAALRLEVTGAGFLTD